jgi:hypothetical protein
VHISHLIHFEKRARWATSSVVTITADRHITKKHVTIVHEPTALSAIEALSLANFVKTVDCFTNDLGGALPR